MVHCSLKPSNLVFKYQNDLHSMQLIGFHNAKPTRKTDKVTNECMDILDGMGFHESMQVSTRVFENKRIRQ